MFFFPGIVVHELAHLITAGILFVPVTRVEFTPELHGDSLKLGSVEMVKTDIIRRIVIGAAPLLLGGTLLLIFIRLLAQTMSSEINSVSVALILGLIYGIFVISNTMFSSKKDMEGGVGLFVVILLVLGGLFFAQRELIFHIFSFFTRGTVSVYFEKVVLLLLIPCGMNLILSGIFLVARKHT